MTPGSNGSSPITQHTLDEAVRLLTEAIAARQAPPGLPPGLAGQDSLRALFETLLEIRMMADTLSRGDLSHQSQARGYVPGALKALQANLRHVTWQAQQVAAGDLSQRMDFLGEFSDAFNTMVAKIAETRLELTELASLDPLTGLLNRRSFFTLASAEWERSVRSEHPLSLIMLDLDHFKRVNDTYGHAIGDIVLSSVAVTCAEGLRRADGLGRYGGEEIVMLLPETNLSSARVAAERIRQQVADTAIETPKGPLSISVSVGIACAFPAELPDVAPGDGIAELIVQSDAALYRAKHEGRNAVRVFTAETPPPDMAEDDGR